jgi:2-dehydro-3-deoxygalactonokinase
MAKYPPDRTRLIALDWGTSSLRAYRLGDSGAILEEISLELGIASLQSAKTTGSKRNSNQAFERVFERACGRWIQNAPSAPILASGMVGSAQGWRETPYIDVPFDLRDLGTNLTMFRTTKGKTVHIVPGLIRRAGLANVMRGEETQLVGALALDKPSARSRKLLIGLPGTHSKWAYLRGNVVEDFQTFVTGELYGALCNHTILGRTMIRGARYASRAFDRGVQLAATTDGNFLSDIFSVRTLLLTGSLSAQEQPDYLSGLLIGHEVAALSKLRLATYPPGTRKRQPVVLVGDSSLCTRYKRALELNHYARIRIVEDSAPRGLYQIAIQAKILSSSQTAHAKVPGRSKKC